MIAIAGTLIGEVLPFLLIWVILLIASFFVPVILPLASGGMLFIVGELTTLEGIRISPLSRHKVHILKGMHRKGEFSEYIFIGLIIIAVLLLPHGREENKFVPYMYDWEKLYEEGIIDAKEWKEHRFDYF
jgi:inner membrane protein